MSIHCADRRILVALPRMSLMCIKVGRGQSRTIANMQRYLMPSAIVIGVIVGTLVLFYMALYGANP
jgi:hypothetical protein